MSLNIEIYETKPQGFLAQIEVAACYLEIDDKFLFLQKAKSRFSSDTWGVPAGKLEKEETPIRAALRELFEETGISASLSQIQPSGTLYIRMPEIHFIYYLFKVHIDSVPLVRLSSEHQNYMWASLEDLSKMPLLPGAEQALHYYRKMSKKKRTGASVNSYLILRQEQNILFHLRKNTKYCDGMWGLVAGHVEDGESACLAMIREAQEEIGLQLLPSQLKAVHIMHRKTDRFNVDIFFDCSSWQGTINNLEPEKCERLEFFPQNFLPSPIIDYLKIALNEISKNKFYSELGWDE